MRMNCRIYSVVLLAVAALFSASCTKNDPDGLSGGKAEGTLLRMNVSFDPQTRLAELPNVGAINDDEHGLKDLGLYIYYQDDYAGDDLSKPYIKNRRCRVSGNELVILSKDGQTEEEGVYVYDNMVIVAFYPYNENPGEFLTRADEEKYPITRKDYAEQTYIPYRAEVRNVNPTNAYYVNLSLRPKHTYKIEVVLVSDQEFPASVDNRDGNIRILPDIDPADNGADPQVGRREVWFDNYWVRSNRTGGSNVCRYTGYIWTENGDRMPNDIEQGELLLETGDFSLIASRKVTVSEGFVYRYGYNLSTGKMFVPTSSSLVWDAESLAGVTGGTYCQVCDIDLDNYPWTPRPYLGGRFDGGGNKISNMKIQTSGSAPVGLFTHIQGATVCNVDLVNPEIRVESGDDQVCVGAITGKLNPAPSPEDIELIRQSLPPLPDELSQVVKDALIEEMLMDALGSRANIAGCRVENPVVTVNGLSPIVGAVAGKVGESNEKANFNGWIWDTYVLDGSIEVNDADREKNEGAYVGGFVGLNNNLVTRSYTTLQDIKAVWRTEKTDPGNPSGPPIITEEDRFSGFGFLGDEFAEPGKFTSSYTELADGNPGVSEFGTEGWPTWGTYDDIWPVYYHISWSGDPANGTFWYNMGAEGVNYPTLQLDRK